MLPNCEADTQTKKAPKKSKQQWTSPPWRFYEEYRVGK